MHKKCRKLCPSVCEKYCGSTTFQNNSFYKEMCCINCSGGFDCSSLNPFREIVCGNVQILVSFLLCNEGTQVVHTIRMNGFAEWACAKKTLW